MRLCVYATTFQADIQAFTLFAAAQPGVEVVLVVESAEVLGRQAVNSIAPLPASLEILERGDPALKKALRAFGADVVVIDNHVPALDVAARVLVLWHGYGWRLDDLSTMRKEMKRRWGDPTRPNPNVLWAAFGEVDREYRIAHSRFHPDNVEALGSPYSDLLLPASEFQRAFSRRAAAPHYSVDVATRKTALLALTWHHGSVFGRFGEDEPLFDALFDALARRSCNAIMRMHDRHRFAPDLLAAVERVAARHANVQLKFKDEHPDALVDLSVSDVMVSNYSSILDHFYFLGRPTIHMDPAAEGGEITYCTWKRGKLRVKRGAAVADVWKLPPDEIGGLRVDSFHALLEGLERALDDPGCCRDLAAGFVARNYVGADGRTCARVYDAMRRRWGLR